ncbi:unnamed protein product [Heterobilharzia americana]|nr:unnamed protein product [Heterobilharzia americana]
MGQNNLLQIVFLIYLCQRSEALFHMKTKILCSNPDQISIIGGEQRRLVTEGGRVTLICCVPGKTNGHDHEQLVWNGPDGKELVNYFSSPISESQHIAYSVPEFHSKGYLITMMVIQKFRAEDSGQYTCRNMNPSSTVLPASVFIDYPNTQNGQVLDISRVDTRHSGIFLCKAETNNPTWLPQDSEYDPRLYESGVVNSPFLIQIQAIRGIVYSRPRLLPGSPMEVFTPSDSDESQLVRPYKHFVTKRQVEQNSNIVQSSPNYLQRVLPLWSVNDKAKDNPSTLSAKNIVQEGGKLILECQARGRPTPQILWYRGGMGSSITSTSQAITFDQRIRSALQHLPLEDVQRELGILIADFDHLFPAVMNLENLSNGAIYKAPDNFGNAHRKGIQNYELGRFQLSTGLRKDDKGDPVIAMSRLTINKLMPSDATRYTCLALLNLNKYGGVGNFTDVGSILPNVVLKPRFVRSGTHLRANGYPGENCSLTCEAYGGLPNEMGLRVRLLKGPGVKKLISYISQSMYMDNKDPDLKSQYDLADYQSGYSSYHKNHNQYKLLSKNSDLSDSSPDSLYTNSLRRKTENVGPNSNDYIEIVKPGMNPRYHLGVEADPRNPYATILRLDITDLSPEDNSFYLLAEPRRVNEVSEQLGGNENTMQNETPFKPGEDVVYGLSHLPSKIACQALGQPTPQWKWVGPQSGPNVPLGEPNDSKGYVKTDYEDGEYSVSELTIPAGYWNVGVFGTYTCTASNRLGQATGHVRLQLASHPGRPTLRACKVEATLIELCVEPPNETGGLPLTHYELRIQTHPRGAFHGPFAYLPGRRVLRLPNLIPGYYYRFALSAVSSAGRGPNAYLQVTTNRLSKPVIKLLASQDYISSMGYNVHWNAETTDGMDINQYNINIRPVEIDYSMGEIAGRPIGSWTHYNNIEPNCAVSGLEGQKICNFLIDDLKPDSAYELELSGQNSMGFSETQRIIFRTSSLTGVNGRILNMPSTMRLTGISTHIQIEKVRSFLFLPLF